jgi:pyrrolidone-carboxylate peptidase
VNQRQRDKHARDKKNQDLALFLKGISHHFASFSRQQWRFSLPKKTVRTSNIFAPIAYKGSVAQKRRKLRTKTIIKPMSNVLLTGFKPWDDLQENPSEKVARQLGGVVLPVDYKKSWEILEKSYREDPVALVLLLGLHRTRKKITLERRARNESLAEKVLVKKAPPLLHAALPLQTIQKCLGEDVLLSYNAGRFVCNYLYYHALYYLPAQTLFLHLPKEESMPLEAQAKKVEEIKETLLHELS